MRPHPKSTLICFVAAGVGIGNYRSLRLPAYSCAQRICSRLDL
ncbi:MAG: hypothetical protein U9P36_06065 [Thermodesulfobacteriota bacterium]|nr:hypothetical protein [Thermodesulfobacteriota bacterium]